MKLNRLKFKTFYLNLNRLFNLNSKLRLKKYNFLLKLYKELTLKCHHWMIPSFTIQVTKD